MRRLLMLVAMALAALAVSVPSALALDHPSDDGDPNNWQPVSVSDDGVSCGFGGCSFDAYGEDWEWRYQKTAQSQPVEDSICSGSWGGFLSEDGSGEVTDPEINSPGAFLMPEPFCQGMMEAQVGGGDVPWPIVTTCLHVPSGEVWTQFELGAMRRYHFDQWVGGLSVARIDGPANGEGGVDPTSIVIGGGHNGAFANVDDLFGAMHALAHRGELVLEPNDLSIAPAGEPGGCSVL